MSYPPKAAAVLYAKNIDRVSAFYAEVTGLSIIHSAEDHIVLESSIFQLVVVAIPEHIAASIELTTPPFRRADTPIKLTFLVESISIARAVATSFGGEVNPAEQEWQFQEYRVCDGHDPEGNVVQFRENAR
jgi:predicted enzyme related to lactoylglutathione lyase